MSAFLATDERGGFCSAGDDGGRADGSASRDARSASGGQCRAAGHDGSGEARRRPCEERKQHRDSDERDHPRQGVVIGDRRRRISADDVGDDGQDAREHHEFHAVADDAADRFFSEERRPARDAERHEEREERTDEQELDVRQDNLDAKDDICEAAKQKGQNASKQNRQIRNHVRPAGAELLLVFEDGIERGNAHQDNLRGMLHDARPSARAHYRTGLDEAVEHDITERSPLIQHEQPKANFEALLDEDFEMVSVLEVREERHACVDRCEQPERGEDERTHLWDAAGRDSFKLIEDLIEDSQIHGSPQFWKCGSRVGTSDGLNFGGVSL